MVGGRDNNDKPGYMRIYLNSVIIIHTRVIFKSYRAAQFLSTANGWGSSLHKEGPQYIKDTCPFFPRTCTKETRRAVPSIVSLLPPWHGTWQLYEEPGVVSGGFLAHFRPSSFGDGQIRHLLASILEYKCLRRESSWSGQEKKRQSPRKHKSCHWETTSRVK